MGIDTMVQRWRRAVVLGNLPLVSEWVPGLSIDSPAALMPAKTEGFKARVLMYV